MNAHMIKTTLTEDGKLTLEDLPFQQGDRVEIIILKCSSLKTGTNSYPVKGRSLKNIMLALFFTHLSRPG